MTAGWYVYAADTKTLFPIGKAGIMTSNPDEASEVAEFIASHAKYGPYVHDAWLHADCWTPR